MDRQRLIVVLNRQPCEHRWESDQLICAWTDGGLTAALDLVLQRYGGTWVAWGSGSAVNDGMNLVAKEYVAAQVCEPRVLLVSQMAGALEELPGACVINPYEIEGLAETIKGALGMPLDGRRRRMRRMRSYLAAHDIHA